MHCNVVMAEIPNYHHHRISSIVRAAFLNEPEMSKTVDIHDTNNFVTHTKGEVNHYYPSAARQ